MKKPNLVFVFADQWRQQATGYTGNPNVKTPHLDSLAQESINFTHAISGCPVCSPYRASLLTGQYPLTHGIFVNDACLQPSSPGIADAFSNAGYDTAYIGKWHVDGHGRSSYIPRKRQLGFDYWKVLECTHAYNNSPYFAGNSDEKLYWDGYDAIAQTKDAKKYIRKHTGGNPFMLMLSWGPPHAPYDTAPEKYRKLYKAEAIKLRPNVPESLKAEAQKWLAGYYAHCSALDACMGELLKELEECSLSDNTIFVFTSDHGDMLGSQGQTKKQRPWDESVRVPFLLRYPDLPDWQPKETNIAISAPDIMPTLLGLSGVPIPESVEGRDFSKNIKDNTKPSANSALLNCPHPFGQWTPIHYNGKEYRGIRTERYTYVCDLKGPWLLYDNELDPYQMQNLINTPEAVLTQKNLDKILRKKLDQLGDEFLPGAEYIKKWNYCVDKTGTILYTN